MLKNELISRMNDTGLEEETLNNVLNSLFSTSAINVRRLILPTDKILSNSNMVAENDQKLLEHEVIIFKTILKKIIQIGIDKFQKYGLNNDYYTKLISLTDEELYNYFKTKVMPNNDSSIINIMTIIGNMCKLSDMTGSRAIDLFEDKVQETAYKQRKSLPVKYTKRIYLNIPFNYIGVEFLTLYKIKCIEKGIPSKMKGMGSSGYDSGDLDTTILYSNDYYFMDHINILEEIIKERPDLVNNFGSPVISGARVTSENGECYYTVSSGLLADATSNTYYNKLYKISFAYMCSQYLDIAEKYDISSLCKMKTDELNKYIEKLLSLLDQQTKSIIIEDGFFKQVVSKISSYMRFNDFDHLDVPLYQDSIFLDYVKSDEVEINVNPDEKDLYLYHTEELINSVLDLYQQGDISFMKLIENYLERITMVYNKYRYYAFREPGFITSDRYMEVSELFRKLLTGYEIPENMEGYEKKEYYLNIQNGINEYLNNRLKKL